MRAVYRHVQAKHSSFYLISDVGRLEGLKQVEEQKGACFCTSFVLAQHGR